MLVEETDPLIGRVMPGNRFLDLARVEHFPIKGIVNLRPVNHSMGIAIRLPNPSLGKSEQHSLGVANCVPSDGPHLNSSQLLNPENVKSADIDPAPNPVV